MAFLGFTVVLGTLLLLAVMSVLPVVFDHGHSTRFKLAVLAVECGILGTNIVLIIYRKSVGLRLANIVARFPGTSLLAIGILFSALLFLSVETLYHIRGTLRAQAEDRVYLPPQFTPGKDAHSKLEVNGETIFDVVYSLEEDYARVTPQTAQPDASNQIVFFGGSFTFGEGVANDETLPIVVSRNAPDWHVTNYGFPGHAAGQMLLRLQDETLLNNISDKEVIVVYIFIPGHIARVIGSMRVSTTWGRNFPYYALTDDGTLENRGNFVNNRSRLNRLYGIIAREKVLAYYKVDFPPRVRDRDLKFMARMIEASKAEITDNLSEARFIVAIYPDQKTNPFTGSKLIPYLEESFIEYLDYTDLFIDKPDYWIKHDGHPNAKAHEELGTRLVQDLALSSPTD